MTLFSICSILSLSQIQRRTFRIGLFVANYGNSECKCSAYYWHSMLCARSRVYTKSMCCCIMSLSCVSISSIRRWVSIRSSSYFSWVTILPSVATHARTHHDSLVRAVVTTPNSLVYLVSSHLNEWMNQSMNQSVNRFVYLVQNIHSSNTAVAWWAGQQGSNWH